MPVHGFTGKFCHFCNRNTPHKIVESDGLKLYICQDTEHEHARQAQEQNAD